MCTYVHASVVVCMHVKMTKLISYNITISLAMNNILLQCLLSKLKLMRHMFG